MRYHFFWVPLSEGFLFTFLQIVDFLYSYFYFKLVFCLFFFFFSLGLDCS